MSKEDLLGRTRTGLPGDEMTCAIPGPRLVGVMRNLEATARIDATSESPAATGVQRFAET
ncbi:MAG: hypothetical protein WAV54_17340 [Acidimicrobiales bacterium]